MRKNLLYREISLLHITIWRNYVIHIYTSLTTHRRLDLPSQWTAGSSSPSPIFSFCSICSSLSLSAALFASSTYLFLSCLAFSFNSPNGSKRSLSGSLKGFATQLPLSVNVVLLGLLFKTSYALFSGGSLNGFGVGNAGASGVGRAAAIGARESCSVDTVSGRVYVPRPKSVLLRSVDRVKWGSPPLPPPFKRPNIEAAEPTWAVSGA
jgi:hypothetical protein